MKCIVYVSRETIEFDSQSLIELAESASNRNAKVGITGYLYFENNHFTQYIEGEYQSIEALWTSLNRDSRHSVLASAEATVDERRFADWNMRQLLHSELVEIQLEHVLTDYLLFVSRLSTTTAEDPQPMWRMVDSIARFQSLVK